MRVWCGWLVGVAVLVSCGCSSSTSAKQSPTVATPAPGNPGTVAAQKGPRPGAAVDPPIGYVAGAYRGFDRNEYPGDDTMRAMMSEHAAFAFTGYWLTVPPGAMFNQWKGKRDILKQQGWGFLILANGKLEAEILKAQKGGTSPATLGSNDAAVAVAAAKNEGFPAHAIIFLDQEEGGRLTDPQAAYLLAWTEAVATSDYRPGVYASGQRVEDDPGVFIDTIEDIRNRVKQGHLHDVAIFDAQDQCPPAPGCTLAAKPLSDAGEPDLIAWQYSQSPRRPSITRSCSTTYAPDNRCYAPGFPKVPLDMDLAATADPSQGR
jgi:hypothetical protein